MTPAAKPMTYDFFAQTDTGRMRSNNEDAVVIDAQNQIVVLADGMGGYNAGEVASSMATALIRSEWAHWREKQAHTPNPSEVRTALEECIEHANEAIWGAASANPHYEGMGTTLVAGVFYDSRLILGHVGDSRCYVLRDGALQQLTRDHSWLQEQVDAGFITAQQAAQSSSRNLVTRALGVESNVASEINEFQVAPSDLFLLCSDGLTDMISDALIAELMCSAGSLQDKGRRLIEAANAHGGRDNVSVLLVQTAAQSTQPRGLISRLLGTP